MTRRDVLKASALAGALSIKMSAANIADTRGFRLGIITDELTPELEQAADFISSYGLHYCELREMFGQNIMNVAEADLNRAKKILDAHKLQVTDIASPMFKWNLPGMPATAEQRDEFKASFTEADAGTVMQKTVKLARFFNTNKVRVFSYWRVEEPEKAYPLVRERLAKAAHIAAANQIVLVLENEHACNVGTGRELGRILRDVNSPSLRGVWDPGNATMLGETPFPDGYNAVRGLFPHMHLKDSRKDAAGKLEWAPVGGGIIDFKGQFEALRRDKYQGTLSLETHYRRPDGNKVESTRESLEGLLKVI